MKKVTFLGVEFDVAPDDEMSNASEGSIYVIIRVEDSDPKAGTPDLIRRRTKTLCDGCRAVCWLDPKSFGRLPAHVDRICMQCALKRTKEATGG